MSSSSTNPACPPRPPAVRGYATLVVALATFLAAMVVLRVPFRGYLIEGRLSGRLAEGQTAGEVQAWLQTAAPGVHARVTEHASGGCDIVLQELTLRATDAQRSMNRVARQFAEQYVVQRQEAARQRTLSRLQAELAAARDTEDLLRGKVDTLRREAELAALAPPAAPAVAPAPEVQLAPASPPESPLASGDAASERLAPLRERLETLRAELAKLLGTFTEQHPQVLTLRAQIAGLEQELFGNIGTNAQPVANVVQEAQAQAGAYGYLAGPPYSALDAAEADLSAATRARQWAERQLQSEVQRLSSSVGLPWSIEPAQIVTRVGGTPRGLTLIGAGLIALVAGGLMFALSRALVPRLVIETMDEIASLLALPLIGQTAITTPHQKSRYWRTITAASGPWTARLIVRGAEIVLAGMMLALVFTVISDRWLASQVLVDPFGVLSEVAGRLLG
ncbi:MAG: hypothetical protein MUF06_22670 [Pirellulaceae bacterium]|jgi:hypothetical protein|nr:hypothetical protein [Pirellulaceae bacterium]